VRWVEDLGVGSQLRCQPQKNGNAPLKGEGEPLGIQKGNRKTSRDLGSAVEGRDLTEEVRPDSEKKQRYGQGEYRKGKCFSDRGEEKKR